MAEDNKFYVKYSPFATASGFLSFYWAQGSPVLNRDGWGLVLNGMKNHYDVYREGKLLNDEHIDQREHKLLQGQQLQTSNYFFLCMAALSSWFAFQNSVRDMIDGGIFTSNLSIYPLARGQFYYEEDVEPIVGFNLYDYLQDRDFLVNDLKKEKGWVYEKTTVPAYAFAPDKKKLKIDHHHFVDSSGKWIYVTFSASLLNLSLFLSFLRNLLLLLSYYDRVGSSVSHKLTGSTVKTCVKTQEEVHEGTCRDVAFCYSKLREALMEIPESERTKAEFILLSEEHWPSVTDLWGYMEELYLLTKEWRGDWSLLRPENYDFFEMLGGLESLHQIFIEIFFGGFLRALVQGQPPEMSSEQQDTFSMGEFQRRALLKSQPHFKFLWDVNLSHSVFEYYGKISKGNNFKKFQEQRLDFLLYNPEWITKDLRRDLLHWLSDVKKKMGCEDSLMPIFGFALTEEGKEEERNFAQILFNPALGISHGREATGHWDANPYGLALNTYTMCLLKNMPTFFELFPHRLGTAATLKNGKNE